MLRTRTAHRPSANARVSRTEDRQNRWANEATQDSRDMQHRPGTTLENPRTWVDNRAPIEDWKQASVWKSAFLHPTSTALTWIPLKGKAHLPTRQIRETHARGMDAAGRTFGTVASPGARRIQQRGVAQGRVSAKTPQSEFAFKIICRYGDTDTSHLAALHRGQH